MDTKLFGHGIRRRTSVYETRTTTYPDQDNGHGTRKCRGGVNNDEENERCDDLNDVFVASTLNYYENLFIANKVLTARFPCLKSLWPTRIIIMMTQWRLRLIWSRSRGNASVLF